MTAEDPDERLRALVHDLRTPLAVVLGFADLLAKHPGDLDETQRDCVARIREAADQLRAIVDDAAQAARSARSGGADGK